MSLAKPDSRRRIPTWRYSLVWLAALPFLLASSSPIVRHVVAPTAEIEVAGTPITVAASAEIDFTEMARRALAAGTVMPPDEPLIFPEYDDPAEPDAPIGTSSFQATPANVRPGFQTPFVASPSPSNNYMGLNDVAMVDSNYIVIPPDVAGGVGPTKVMESFNNNYRIRDKATGVTQLTMGTATFWSPVEPSNLLASLTDPRTTYDPYNNCWIAVMQSVNANGDILLGVSKTSDPAGAWYLYRFTGFTSSYLLDFPIIGFNKNWIAITINRYTSGGSFSLGICLAVNYPLARTGTGSGTLFTQAAGTHFCSAPAVTYSAVEDTLFLVTHLSSGGATYTMDRITGTPAAPVYTSGASNVRPGGGWVQPSGNIQPQSNPVAGASVCAPACKIETSDAQVRSSPVYRNGFIYYAQSVGLPSTGLTHTAAQWTKLTPSTTPAFADGGRLDDGTATSTNGGKWYSHPSISVNSTNDFMLGFTQFSSAQHPSSGYAMHLGTDLAGTLRDPLIYHTGEDYYHKTFSTATGRNRWGDFSTTQVDPCDDQTLWTLQEYAKTRTGTDDGNTGSNSSKWSSWWAAVNGVAPAVGLTCAADTLGAANSPVVRKFRITNTGTAAGTFSYLITDVSGWGGPASGTTPPLAPSSFFDVFVSFVIAPNCVPAFDVVTMTAQPVAATGCYAAVQCTSKIYCDVATPTLLARFDAQPVSDGVDLSWWSDAVGQISGWNVYRANTVDGNWSRINTDPIAMNAGGEFHLHDAGVRSGEYLYRLGALLPGGTESALGSARVAVGAQAFSFSAIGGNPFTASTALRYTVPQAQKVRIDIYNVAGQRVRTLVNRSENAGEHTVQFALHGDGLDLAPGIYMARITAGTQRMTLHLIGIK